MSSSDAYRPGPVELAERTEYGQLVQRVRRIVNVETRPGANVLVVSDGDPALLRFTLRAGWHFPQLGDGTYAGFLPTDDADAIEQLEHLRENRAEFLVFPAFAFWWLDHYVGFREHLEREYERLWADESCVVFNLGLPSAEQPQPRLRPAPDEIPPARRPFGTPHPPTSGMVDVDIERSRLHQRFFDRFPVESFDEFRDVMPGAPDLHSFQELEGGDNVGYSGWAYWYFLLRGYAEYCEGGTVGKGNSYYEYLHRFTLPARRADRGLADELGNPLTAIERVARRFRDLDYHHHPGVHNPVGLYGPAPVRLIVSDPAPPRTRPIYVWGADAPLMVKRIDGHHRLFAARLFGAVEHRGLIVSEPRELGHLRGALEDFLFDGKRLQARGWCLHPHRQIESFEVRRGDAVVAVAWVEGRPDIAEAFPAVPHAVRSGFSVDVEHVAPVDSPERFEVVARSDWLPIGAITAPHVPGMFETGASPGEALRAVKVLDGMLRPVARHRALESFKSVHVSESDLPLEQFVPRLMPSAAVVSAEAELLAAYSVLPQLTPSAQMDWLRSARGLLRPGGYLALSVLGELVRPFIADSELAPRLVADGIARNSLTYQTSEYTVRQCASLFEVVEYVEGGVDDREDLVLLRRPA